MQPATLTATPSLLHFFILTDHIKCNLHEGFRGYDKRLRNPLLYSIGEMSSVFLFCVLRNDFEVAHFESSFIVVFSRFKFTDYVSSW